MRNTHRGKCSTRAPQKRRIPPAKRHAEGRNQHPLGTEKQILRSISARVETSVILNEICRALDFQIGGVVSLISLPGDDPGELVSIVMKATLYGLSTFCSESVVARNNKKLLGTLEMYCSDPRSPSPGEHELIERAKYLAALAINRDVEARRRTNSRVLENRLVSGHFHAELEHVN